MKHLLLTLFSVALMCSCTSLDYARQGRDQLQVSLRRPGESAPTVVIINGSEWKVTSPKRGSVIGQLRDPSAFWRAVSVRDLARFDGSHVDPYSPDYRWELNAVFGDAGPIAGSGTHFGADFALLSEWNSLSALMDQVIDPRPGLRVDRSTFEAQQAEIVPPWER